MLPSVGAYRVAVRVDAIERNVDAYGRSGKGAGSLRHRHGSLVVRRILRRHREDHARGRRLAVLVGNAVDDRILAGLLWCLVAHGVCVHEGEAAAIRRCVDELRIERDELLVRAVVVGQHGNADDVAGTHGGRIVKSKRGLSIDDRSNRDDRDARDGGLRAVTVSCT
jgi:hypothetical protein